MTTTIPRVALDAHEAAASVGMKYDAVMRAIRSGKLRAKRSGENGGGKYLVKLADLEAWFDGLGDA